MKQLPQIHLRALEPDDLDMLYRIENDRQLWDVGATSVPYSRYVLHDYIANASGDIYTDRQVRLVVENGVGEAVGLADIISFDAKNLRAEVGIVIDRQHRSRGYAHEALRQVADYALHVLHLHQLYAFIACDNQVSMQLFAKAGFQRSATLKDWLYDGKCHHEAALMQLFL